MTYSGGHIRGQLRRSPPGPSRQNHLLHATSRQLAVHDTLASQQRSRDLSRFLVLSSVIECLALWVVLCLGYSSPQNGPQYPRSTSKVGGSFQLTTRHSALQRIQPKNAWLTVCAGLSNLVLPGRLQCIWWFKTRPTYARSEGATFITTTRSC